MGTPNNLPAELTSFVGREPQLADLRRLLHRSRLVTLTGPGGAGKTRLALRLAAENLDRKPDGVWLADMAPIGDTALLERSVASLCGIREDAKRSLLDVLAEGIATSRILIVLDGCEHLVEACAELAERLLRSCPRLTIVVTSREPLGVTGEVIWRTPSLTLPHSGGASRPELLMESEAVRLFVDRARLSRPEFALNSTNATAIAQICTRLEGIPLAIELAAGLAGMMTLDDILDRLRHRFRLLTGGSRTSLPRHQTLRQAVDWSYGLLGATEQALFTRLGIFAGGFELAAAEAVVAGDPIEVDQVLPILSRIVLKSLVVSEPTRPHSTRYRMLDTIREYALEKLQQSGEAEWRRRHADYFTQWTAEVVPRLSGKDQVQWLGRMDEEQPNLRLALEWSLADQPDNALRLAGVMGQYWAMRRTLVEGFDWLGRALEVRASRADLRVVPLISRSTLSRRIGDYATSARHAEEAARIATEFGMQSDLARAKNLLGIIASHEGDLPKALAYFEECFRSARAGGVRAGVASSLNNVALMESAMGDQTAALEHVNMALAETETTGDRFQRSNIQDTAARINFRLGHREVAKRNWQEAITTSLEFEDTMNIADCLEGFALLAMVSDEAERSITLVSAADSLRAALGADRTAEWAAEVDESDARAASRLTKVVVEGARRRGAGMTLRQAVEFALGEPAAGRRSDGSPLTEREVEVARLIAEGMTNGEVAGRLRISERTVDAHVEHIRNKVGLRTRAQIAVWVKERLGTA